MQGCINLFRALYSLRHRDPPKVFPVTGSSSQFEVRSSQFGVPGCGCGDLQRVFTVWTEITGTDSGD